MSKLRISVVQYLNTAPLVRGFTHGAMQNKYELAFTVPSQCAEALRSGAADVAIVPAIEYPRIVAAGVPLTILPGLAIASKERVRSLLLLSRVPIRQARRIALDPSSRSTQALVKILAAKRWQISPQFFEPAPPNLSSAQSPRDAQSLRSEQSSGNGDDGNVPDKLDSNHRTADDKLGGRAVGDKLSDDIRDSASDKIPAMLSDADATLVIGDLALRIAIAAETHVTRGPDVEWLTSGATIGIPSIPQLHIYDVVKEWWHLTEKPAVLAVWAVRDQSFANNVVPAELVSDFLASRDFGLTQIPEICAEAAREMRLPEKELRLYLEKNIDYTLDSENLQGLQRFFELSSALGLIGPLSSISIAGTDAIPARYVDYVYANKRA